MFSKIDVTSDAMNEVAWCYLEGFGCKKDKVRDTESDLIQPFPAQNPSRDLLLSATERLALFTLWLAREFLIQDDCIFSRAEAPWAAMRLRLKMHFLRAKMHNACFYSIKHVRLT